MVVCGVMDTDEMTLSELAAETAARYRAMLEAAKVKDRLDAEWREADHAEQRATAAYLEIVRVWRARHEEMWAVEV